MKLVGVKKLERPVINKKLKQILIDKCDNPRITVRIYERDKLFSLINEVYAMGVIQGSKFRDPKDKIARGYIEELCDMNVIENENLPAGNVIIGTGDEHTQPYKDLIN